MSYELSIRKEYDHLHVRAMGSLTLEALIALITNVHSLCIEHEYKRVLIDVDTMKGELDPLDSYMFSSEYLPGLGFDSQIKMAIIDLEENCDRLQIVMYNARSRGLDVMVFFNADRAVTWLDIQKQPVSQ